MDDVGFDPSHQDHPELRLICSNSDADSTASDLTGPGRAVDNFYCFAGRYVERFVDGIAARFGMGPLPTAQRIRQLRAEIIAATIWHPYPCRCWECCRLGDEFGKSCKKTIIRSPAAMKKLEQKIRKKCKSLISYIENSKELSTQSQALDSLLDLIILDSELRNILDVCGARMSISRLATIYENFRFSNFEAEDLLLARSRHALVLLEETRLQTFLKDFINSISCRDGLSEGDQQKWSEIAKYLQSPKYAFIFVRVFRKLVHNTWTTDELNLRIVHAIHCAVRDSPVHFEWNVFEETISGLIKLIYRHNDCVREMVDWLFRNILLMPGICETISSLFLFAQPLVDFNESPYPSFEFNGSHYICNVLMRGVCHDDNQEISLVSLESKYSYEGLQPILKELVCPLRRTISNFVGRHRIDFANGPTPAEIHLYDEIVAFVDGSDTELQARAWEYIHFFVEQDIYRCNAMLDALSRTEFIRALESSDHLESLRKTCLPRPIKNKTYWFSFETSLEKIQVPYKWIMSARRERGEVSSLEGLMPLAAGIDGTGNRTYLISIQYPAFSCGRMIQGIVEYWTRDDIKPEDLRVEVFCPHRNALRIPIKFFVPYLRYAPEVYAKYLGTDVEGLHITTPIFCGNFYSDGSVMFTRVITIEEAFAAGYSAEEIYPPDEKAYLRKTNCDKRYNWLFGGEDRPPALDVDGVLGADEIDSDLCSEGDEMECYSDDGSSMARSGFQEDETIWSDEHGCQSSTANNVEDSISSEDTSHELDGLEDDLAGSSAIIPDRTNDLLGVEKVSEGDRPGDYSGASGENGLLPDANHEEAEPDEIRSSSMGDDLKHGPDELEVERRTYLKRSPEIDQGMYEVETQPCEEHANQSETKNRSGSLMSRNGDPYELGGLGGDDGGKSNDDKHKGLMGTDPSSEEGMPTTVGEDDIALNALDEVKEGERRWQLNIAISERFVYLISLVLAFVLGQYLG